jgi:hypothetical protein
MGELRGFWTEKPSLNNLSARPGVPAIKQDIRKNQDPVEGVQIDYSVEIIEYFVKYAGDVARQDDKKEGDALAGVGPRFIRPVNRKRPGRPEADKHYYFEDTELHGSENIDKNPPPVKVSLIIPSKALLL